jgi:two-component system response regulator RegA
VEAVTVTGAELGRVGEPAIRKVLLVDDHEVVLRSMARDFDREGVEPLKAANREEAMELFARENPELAIVDLFLRAPENGLQLLAELKAILQPPFCILVSAHMSVAHAVMGMKAGADDVFLKPFGARQAPERVSGESPSPEIEIQSLDQIEWEHIARVLGDYDGNITHAAEALGMYRQSLQRKIQKHAPRVLHADELPPTTPTSRRRRRPS